MRKLPIIEKISTLDEELYNAILMLLPQVTSKNPLPSREEIVSILDSGSTMLLFAKYPDEQGPIAGMLAFTHYMVPSGKNGHIDDFVVNSAFRRKGIGRALIDRALNIAKEMKLNQVSLTSNPSRIEANKLYRSIGFNKIVTNVYRYDI
ncbi:GNAT family N-acetyltransferase [Chloroflexota bacterium]